MPLGTSRDGSAGTKAVHPGEGCRHPGLLTPRPTLRAVYSKAVPGSRKNKTTPPPPTQQPGTARETSALPCTDTCVTGSAGSVHRQALASLTAKIAVSTGQSGTRAAHQQRPCGAASSSDCSGEGKWFSGPCNSALLQLQKRHNKKNKHGVGTLCSSDV